MCKPGNACGCGGSATSSAPLIVLAVIAVLVLTGLAAAITDFVYALLIGAVLTVAGSLAVLVLVLRRERGTVMWRPTPPAEPLRLPAGRDLPVLEGRVVREIASVRAPAITGLTPVDRRPARH